MSLLDKASLIVTPNSYKESKLYSVVPNTTLGDMDVVRATTATRVNSAGLIEVVPRNLLTYSNTFTDTSWINNNAIITTNVVVSPNGLINASSFTGNGTSSFKRLYENAVFTLNQKYTISIFVKANTNNFIQLLFGTTSFGDFAFANFNLQNGTIGTIGSGVTAATIENHQNGWYRCTITSIAIASSTTLAGICLASSGTSLRSESNTLSTSVYIYGAQLEQGTTATEYFPTTTRLNIPRIDYTNGSCPSLLVEGQRTNLNLYSEQFDNAYWTKSRVSISANTSATTDPSGNNNADLVTQDAVDTNGGTVFRSLTFTAAAHTFIVFAKMNEVRYINLAENVSSGSTRRTWFDLQSGVIGTTSAGHTAKIENYGNGWYRCSITFTALAIANSVFVYLSNADGSTAAVVSKGSYFYGAQLEAGSYPTSYIPTVASTVTRNADVISKTGISSLIGTEFTMFFDGFESMGGASSRYLILKGASTTYNNYISIEGLSGNRIGFYIYNNVGALVFAASSGAFTNGQRIKLAARCKNNDFAVYLNGVLLGSQASGTVPTTSNLYLGYYTDYTDNYNKINSATIFNTALTNTELAQLTTL